MIAVAGMLPQGPGVPVVSVTSHSHRPSVSSVASSSSSSMLQPQPGVAAASHALPHPTSLHPGSHSPSMSATAATAQTQQAQPTRRYIPYKVLGQGAFGTVICAKDVQTNNIVAVKKIQHIFDNALASRRVLREIKLLRALDHPNIVSCSDVLYPRNSIHAASSSAPSSGGKEDPADNTILVGGAAGGGGMVPVPGGSPPSASSANPQKDGEQPPQPQGVGAAVAAAGQSPPYNPKLDRVYLVTEFVDTDLHRVIRSQQALTPKHVQYFMFQAFCALDYLHRRNVLHRDMKPSNLLVKKNCELKICDFGLARVDKNPVYSQDALDPPLATGMTEHVATRWYRAPEVILSNGMYGKAMDVWGLGCIFAELLTRRPLFPGKHYLDQLQLITDVTGAPSEAEIQVFESEKARAFLRSLAHKQKVPLGQVLPGIDPVAIDLLEQTLIFDARRRISASKALLHPYFKALYPSRAREIAQPVQPLAPFSFDDTQTIAPANSANGSPTAVITTYQPNVTPEQWRSMIAEEVADFYRARKAAAAAAAAGNTSGSGGGLGGGSVASSVASWSPAGSNQGDSPHSHKSSPAVGAAAAAVVSSNDQEGGRRHSQPVVSAAQAQAAVASLHASGAHSSRDEKRVPLPVPNPYAMTGAAPTAHLVTTQTPPPGTVTMTTGSPMGVAAAAVAGAGGAAGSGSNSSRALGSSSPLRVTSSPAHGHPTMRVSEMLAAAAAGGALGTPTRVDSPVGVDSPMRRGELGSDNSLNDSAAHTMNNSTALKGGGGGAGAGPRHSASDQPYSGSPRSNSSRRMGGGKGLDSPGRTSTRSPKPHASLRKQKILRYMMANAAAAAAAGDATAAGAGGAATGAHAHPRISDSQQFTPITGGSNESPRLLTGPNGTPPVPTSTVLTGTTTTTIARTNTVVGAGGAGSAAAPGRKTSSPKLPQGMTTADAPPLQQRSSPTAKTQLPLPSASSFAPVQPPAPVPSTSSPKSNRPLVPRAAFGPTSSSVVLPAGGALGGQQPDGVNLNATAPAALGAQLAAARTAMAAAQGQAHAAHHNGTAGAGARKASISTFDLNAGAPLAGGTMSGDTTVSASSPVHSVAVGAPSPQHYSQPITAAAGKPHGSPQNSSAAAAAAAKAQADAAAAAAAAAASARPSSRDSALRTRTRSSSTSAPAGANATNASATAQAMTHKGGTGHGSQAYAHAPVSAGGTHASTGRPPSAGGMGGATTTVSTASPQPRPVSGRRSGATKATPTGSSVAGGGGGGSTSYANASTAAGHAGAGVRKNSVDAGNATKPIVGRRPSGSGSALAAAGASTTGTSSTAGGGGGGGGGTTLPRFASPTASSARAAAAQASSTSTTTGSTLQRQNSGSSRGAGASATTSFPFPTDSADSTAGGARAGRRASGSGASGRPSLDASSKQPVHALAATSTAGVGGGGGTAPVVKSGLPGRRPSASALVGAAIVGAGGGGGSTVATASPHKAKPQHQSSLSGQQQPLPTGAHASPRTTPPSGGSANSSPAGGAGTPTVVMTTSPSPTAGPTPAPYVVSPELSPAKPVVTVNTAAAAAAAAAAGAGAASTDPTSPNAAAGGTLGVPTSKPVRSSPISKMSRRPDGSMADGSVSPVHSARAMSFNSLLAATGQATITGGGYSALSAAALTGPAGAANGAGGGGPTGIGGVGVSPPKGGAATLSSSTASAFTSSVGGATGSPLVARNRLPSLSNPAGSGGPPKP